MPRPLLALALLAALVASAACDQHPSDEPVQKGASASVAELPPSFVSAAPVFGNEAEPLEFEALEKEALRGDYQAQRNVAYLLSGSSGRIVPHDPIKACAWRLAILELGDSRVDDSDVGNKEFDCDRQLDADALAAAEAKSHELVRSASVAKAGRR